MRRFLQNYAIIIFFCTLMGGIIMADCIFAVSFTIRERGIAAEFSNDTKKLSILQADSEYAFQQKDLEAFLGKYGVNTAINLSKVNSQSGVELYQYITERANVYIHMINPVIWNGEQVDILQVNQLFCELYQIDVKQGRMFLNEELDGHIEEEKAIPVLVGEKLAKKYPIGTKLTNQALDQSIFEIVGILKDGAFYLNPSTDQEIISLDSSFVVPWIPKDSLNSGYRNINLFHVMQLETDNPEVLKEISLKSKELGLFDLEFISFKEQIEVVEEYYQSVYMRDCAMLMALLLYCIVGSITMLLQYINTHMRYASIHMLCGAVQRDISLQMLVQISTPILIGLVLVLIVFRNIFAMIAGIIFGIILLSIILAIPVFIWNRLQVSQIFKRYD